VNRRQFWITAAILGLGVLAGLFMVLADGTSRVADEHADGEARGAHGGRLLEQDGFALEVTIFERGVPPEFRVYATHQGKPANPADVRLEAELSRLGATPEALGFRAQQDFLRGEREVEEPHSFAVEMHAQYGGRDYRWTYEQFEGRVTMDEATARNAGIAVVTAAPARIRSVRHLQGEIHFNQDRLVRVVPRLAGVVTKARANLGDRVRSGDVLAVLESQALGDLKSEFYAVRQRLALARTSAEREKRLWEEKISAEQDYLASRQALAEAEIAHRNASQRLAALGAPPDADGANLAQLEIRSPIDGVVIEKRVATGEAVAAEANIYVIADLSSVWAEVTLYPADLAAVKLGQKVTVRAGELNASAEGVIAYVGALLGEQTRTAKARITLPNPGQRWRPGLFVTVDLVQEEREVPIAVPVEAIQSLRDWKVVFARFGDVFEARPVELGRSDGKLVEVVSGLAAGQPVATANSFVLKADLGKAGASHDH
jgi:cobalt-zinc-cadmium efflux system membrane fusion protein